MILVSYPTLTLVLAHSLSTKLIRARDGVAKTQPTFEQLTSCLDPSLIQEWMRQKRLAIKRQGDHLTIYNVKSTKCRRIYNSTAAYGSLNLAAPTLAEIRLKMSEMEVQQGNLSGGVSTLMEGLAIEKSQ